jgi:hypothetical protein
MESTESDDNYAQYIDSHRSIGGGGSPAYPIQTQEAAQKKADVKHHYHSYLSLFKNPLQEPLEPLSNEFGRLLNIVGLYVNPVDIQIPVIG